MLGPNTCELLAIHRLLHLLLIPAHQAHEPGPPHDRMSTNYRTIVRGSRSAAASR